MQASRIVVLAGGVGAARFLSGLVRVMPPEEITVIVNTADDDCFYGLHVSPDIDTILYTLAGLAPEERGRPGDRGWGIQGDTFHCLEALGRLSHDTWFQVGDRDLATHLHRTLLLGQGQSLSQVTAHLARAYGLGPRLLPMSDDPVRTQVETPGGWLDFQEYLVRRGAADPVKNIAFAGIEAARPAPGVLEALTEAQGVIVAPSNPLISIGPILALAGVREALRASRAQVLAISPIVGGRAIKGPAAAMLQGLGLEVSAYQVAALYKEILDVFVLDQRDVALRPRIEALGVGVLLANTIMDSLPAKERLARAALSALECSGP